MAAQSAEEVASILMTKFQSSMLTNKLSVDKSVDLMASCVHMQRVAPVSLVLKAVMYLFIRN
jgi:hypothetical protein